MWVRINQQQRFQLEIVCDERQQPRVAQALT